MFDASIPSLPAVVGRRLEMAALYKRYGAVPALDDVSLDVAAGEFVTLLGPSGSGKTTLLMAVAGFTPPDSGSIKVDGSDITAMPPERREFGMVFQGYALFPHLSVAENIAFPLVMRRTAKSEIDRRVAEAIDLVQLAAHRDKLPRQLSGGQQQRTALARALVFRPGVLLLDEPLSALDKALREELQWEMKALHRRVGVTFLNVTHDQQEALALSDRVVVMRAGRIVQVGQPRTLYEAPRTRFVASFLGGSTFIEGTVCGREDRELLYRSGEHVFRQTSEVDAPIGSPIVVSIRPERFRVGESVPERWNTIKGAVREAIYAGADVKLKVHAAGAGLVTLSASAHTLDARMGEEVVLSWAPDAGMQVDSD
jgi:putative spermidine/putrescine transport system ATP-binding protein